MASQWAMQIAAGLLPTTYAQRTTRRAQEKVADALDAARKAGIEEAAAYAAAHQYRKSFAEIVDGICALALSDSPEGGDADA
jgi:hypothetical protein